MTSRAETLSKVFVLRVFPEAYCERNLHSTHSGRGRYPDNSDRFIVWPTKKTGSFLDYEFRIIGHGATPSCAWDSAMNFIEKRIPGHLAKLVPQKKSVDRIRKT